MRICRNSIKVRPKGSNLYENRKVRFTSTGKKKKIQQTKALAEAREYRMGCGERRFQTRTMQVWKEKLSRRSGISLKL